MQVLYQSPCDAGAVSVTVWCRFCISHRVMQALYQSPCDADAVSVTVWCRCCKCHHVMQVLCTGQSCGLMREVDMSSVPAPRTRGTSQSGHLKTSTRARVCMSTVAAHSSCTMPWFTSRTLSTSDCTCRVRPVTRHDLWPQTTAVGGIPMASTIQWYVCLFLL